MLRTLRIARARHGWQPPRGATHVLQWEPPWRVVPADPEGWWKLDTLQDWLAGMPQGNMPSLDGPAELAGDWLRTWVEGEFGEQYRLTAFEVEIEADDGHGLVAVPAYWVIQAG